MCEVCVLQADDVMERNRGPSRDPGDSTAGDLFRTVGSLLADLIWTLGKSDGRHYRYVEVKAVVSRPWMGGAATAFYPRSVWFN